MSVRRVRLSRSMPAALNGGDHANDLIVNGFGQTVTQVQDVIVRGRAGFTVQVVR
ncbi:MAG: hypothetical protein WD965_05445 [Actinomycetota bacterium]